jgi:hypothetical protein
MKTVATILVSLSLCCVSSPQQTISGADDVANPPPVGREGPAPSASENLSQPTNQQASGTVAANVDTDARIELSALKVQVGELNNEVALLKQSAGRDINSTTAFVVAIGLPPLLLFLYMIADRIGPLLGLKNLLKGRTKDSVVSRLEPLR